MITGAGNENIAVEAMKLGAQDYIIKDSQARFLELIPSVIEQALDRKRLMEEKLASERALRESERLFRRTFDQAPLGAAIVSLDGRCQRANAEACRFTGYPEEELNTLSMHDITHPEHLKEDRENVGKLLAGEIEHYQTDKRYVGKDGEIVWGRTSARLVSDADGTPLYFLPMVQDITELKNTEERMRFQAQLLDSVRESIVATDLQGRVTYWGRGAEELFGFSPDEVLGKPITVVFSFKNQEEGLKCMRTVLDKGHWRGRSEQKRKDGTIFWADTSISLIKDVDGNPAGLVGIDRDITVGRTWEDQIRKSLNEKEILLSEVHHRVKNNLLVVADLLDLQADISGGATQHEMLQDARNRVKSMALAHEMLGRTRNLAEIRVAEYVTRLVDHLAGSLGRPDTPIKVEKRLEDISFRIETVIPLGFIVTELVSDCFKQAFSVGEQGRIEVSLRSIGGGEFELTVQDNGVGIGDAIRNEDPRSLGTELITALVHQLHGEIEATAASGTKIQIRFREAKSLARNHFQ
ncbi:PAS domain S-box protein [Thermodesulfobacteriota bacterium]